MRGIYPLPLSHLQQVTYRIYLEINRYFKTSSDNHIIFKVETQNQITSAYQGYFTRLKSVI
jgi:hypothetical protein